MSAADRPISEAVLDRVCAAYAAIADDCMGLVRRKAMRAALAEYAAAQQQQEQEALHPGIRDKMQAAEDELRAEIERLRGNVRPRREDECLTLDHWRMRAYDLERNWARCSHACAVERAKREQAEALAERLRAEVEEWKDAARRASEQQDSLFREVMDSIERLRSFVVERGKIAGSSDIVTACNNSVLRLSDLRALLDALEAAQQEDGRGQ